MVILSFGGSKYEKTLSFQDKKSTKISNKTSIYLTLLRGGKLMMSTMLEIKSEAFNKWNDGFTRKDHPIVIQF